MNHTSRLAQATYVEYWAVTFAARPDGTTGRSIGKNRLAGADTTSSTSYSQTSSRARAGDAAAVLATLEVTRSGSSL